MFQNVPGRFTKKALCSKSEKGQASAASFLAKDLTSLMADSTAWNGDVTIFCHGEVFEVHKIILAARSRVFARMLDTDMKEAEMSFIRITDFNSKAMATFVRRVEFII